MMESGESLFLESKIVVYYPWKFPVIYCWLWKVSEWNLPWHQWYFTCPRIYNLVIYTVKQKYTCELSITKLFNSTEYNLFAKPPGTVIHMWRWNGYFNILGLACRRNFCFLMQFPKCLSAYLGNILKTDTI